MKIPALTDVSDTLADLRAQRDHLRRTATALIAEWFEYSRTPVEDPAPTTAPEVSRLLGRDPEPAVPSRAERLAEMAREISVHEAAADVLSRDIREEEGRASAIIRERAAPEFKARLRAVALALIEAQKGNAKLYALREELEAAGVRGVSDMTSVAPHLLGAPRDPYGALNIWLREASREGVVTKSEIPEAAR